MPCSRPDTEDSSMVTAISGLKSSETDSNAVSNCYKMKPSINDRGKLKALWETIVFQGTLKVL